ncbi:MULTISPECIES: phenylacetate--CoA ligase family protein [Aeribacillus]|jgi:phenylacetate-CoA ligase|uniref:Phenylacetate--CoA ligase n=1 Tax=Aeribacillus pallidus TaxID=33936 RepID=A0A223E4S8_9BACI|nr:MULTISPECIES: AMP-binding protein [Aeribacillus]ASS90229.1 phenylacetate--CoA ligase [Aeribacillus pallidus]MED0703827.1 AMP-binding protein [Aeribacillus composti]REJ24539.1 MAG: phenylacetate--CoA ligase family protein [Bacillaceae bacterium]TVZ85287.1 phenylacetate-CoA ligase [Aeribacillus composti]
MVHTVQTQENELRSLQLQKLNRLLHFVLNHNEFYKEKLAGLKLPLQSLEEMKKLPFTMKKELVDDQNNHPPYGKNHSYPLEEYVRYHQTSGTSGKPLKILDTKKSFEWWETCWLEVYRSSGVTKKDRVFFAFSFGPFIGFWAAFEGAKRLGALSISSGSQTSIERLRSMIENRATVLVCTPSYALHLAEVAEENGIDIKNGPVQKIITAGEPGGSVPSTRKQIESLWGAVLYDHVGMTEMGAYGYSCSEQKGIHVNESEFIVEVINPNTLEPVEVGEKGELVLTNLGRESYPVIRYRTGDIVIRSDQQCECGNSYQFFPGGILGRADDMVIIRGINIYPSSIESIIREFKEVKEFRIVYYTENEMDQIKVEIECDSEQIVPILATKLRERVGLRIQVEKVPDNELPRFTMKARRVVDNRKKR